MGSKIKYSSFKEEVRNMRNNYLNWVRGRNEWLISQKMSTDYTVLIYAHRKKMLQALKAFKNFDERIVAVFPDEPALIFSFTENPPPFIRDMLIYVQKCSYDLPHYNKKTNKKGLTLWEKLMKAKALLNKAMTEDPTIRMWMAKFWDYLFNEHKDTMPGLTGRNFVCIVLESVKT